MDTVTIMLAVMLVSAAVLVIYIIIDAPRYNAAAEAGRKPDPNASKAYSEVPSPPAVTDPRIVYYYYYYYSYYYDHHNPTNGQPDSEAPKPPPVTDPRIVDFYYNCYCHYYDYYNPTNGQRDSEAPKPPPVTDPSIVYYYHYYHSYYFRYHEENGTSRSRHPRHKKKRHAFSSRITSPVRPAASRLTAAVSSHASARGTQQMNIRSSQGLSLEIGLHDELGIEDTSADQPGQPASSVSAQDCDIRGDTSRSDLNHRIDNLTLHYGVTRV